MADVNTLYWRDLLPKGLILVISLGPQYELTDLQVVEADDESSQSDERLYEGTSFAQELRRAVARSLAGCSDVPGTRDRLQRLKEVWQRSRRSAPLMRPKLSSLGSPLISQSSNLRLKLFIDRVGSHTAEVSWVLLGSGPDGEEVASYELEILQHRTSTTSCNRIKLRSRSATRETVKVRKDGLESLGSFQVGGETSRTFVARRLEPLRWYRLRIRAVGISRSWISPWSDEVPFKTISIEDAKAAGIYVSPDQFLVASERQIRAIAALGDRLDDDEIEDMPGYAFAKDVLDARYTKNGWTDFVRMGTRYCRPAATREQRLQRMKLVLAAQECYSQDLLDGNHWSMGPFYYERVGLKNMQRAGMCSA